MDIQEKIDSIVSRKPPSVLKGASAALSQTYRASQTSQSIFANEAQTLAYLGVRFPATYAAVFACLQALVTRMPHFSCETILDLGSGPATATLAALEFFQKPIKATLIEKSKDAIGLGKELLDGEAEWICQDLMSLSSFPKADLAILSYSLGELSEGSFLKSLWQSDVQTILIVEPGTPIGYQTILRARDLFSRLGGKIVAPCPHDKKCPLQPPNWCHFSVRLARTKLHRMLKGGSLGFEDEKFSYLIVTKQSVPFCEQARILRHPHKGSGHVRLNLCTPDGAEKEVILSKKGGEAYRSARDAKWGGIISFF